jgi:hypothetical protein
MRAGRRSRVRSTISVVGAPVSASSQPRGLIISIMSPMTRVGEGSQIRSTSGTNRAPESVSSQPRGFTTSPPGEHLWPTGPSKPWRSSPSVRTIPRCSDSWSTPVGAVDRLAKGSNLVFVVIADDIRPGHRANEPTGSPTHASSHSSRVAPSHDHVPERERRTASPEGSRSNAPSLGLHSLTEWRKSGSKIDVQYYWTWRPRRWPTPWACPRDALGFAALGEKA